MTVPSGFRMFLGMVGGVTGFDSVRCKGVSVTGQAAASRRTKNVEVVKRRKLLSAV